MSRRVRALSQRTYPWTDLDPDRRNAVLLVAGISVVVALALGLIGYGYYSDRIAPDHATVLVIGDRKFNYDFLERRALADLIDGKIQVTPDATGSTSSSLADGISQTLASVSREELVRQTAKLKGITVSADEFDKALRQQLSLTDQSTPADEATALRSELLTLHLSQSEYYDMVRAGVLEQKLSDQIEATIPAQLEQANLLLIETSDQDSAQKAHDAVTDIASFALQATQVSIHSSKDNGGQLGWVPRGALPQDVEDAAFSGLGLSGVIQDTSGYFVTYTQDIQTKDVTDDQKQQIAAHGLSTELQQTQDQVGLSSKLNVGQVQQLAAKLQSYGG